MKKTLIAFILSLVLIVYFQTTTVLSTKPTQDSEELRLQDMHMNMLAHAIVGSTRSFLR
jgi:CTP synthase (UTP-ammonia lyase)